MILASIVIGLVVLILAVLWWLGGIGKGRRIDP
jgi:hypothetical protein